MVGRQLPFFSLIVPFWLIWAFAGWRGMIADLARDPGLRRLFRGPAIPDLELHQSLDRRHRRLADLDGLPDRLPARSGSRRSCGCRRRCAAATIPPRPCRRRRRQHKAKPTEAPRSGGRCCRGSSSASSCWSGAPAGSRALVNPIFTWNYAGRRPAQPDQQGAAGGGEADAGGRGVRLHLSVVHRAPAC